MKYSFIFILILVFLYSYPFSVFADVRGTKWGMSKNEIFNKEIKLNPIFLNSNQMKIVDIIMDNKVIINYFFENEKLVYVAYLFDKPEDPFKLRTHIISKIKEKHKYNGTNDNNERIFVGKNNIVFVYTSKNDSIILITYVDKQYYINKSKEIREYEINEIKRKDRDLEQF